MIIFSSFVLNGVFQERNLQKTYDGKHFKFATGFMMFQTAFMIIICMAIKLFKKEKLCIKKIMQKELILSGVFQALSIYSTIMMSIKVDYLFNVLLRSSKFLTILIGTLVFKTHAHNVSKKDLFWGAVLTLGVIVFSLGQESKSKHGVHISGYLYGIFSLICDAFVAHY